MIFNPFIRFRERSFAGYPIVLAVSFFAFLPAAGSASLQERIDAAKEGEILHIEAGHYFGNIVIDKPMVLRGEGFPHIEGDVNGKTIRILAPGVTIDGFRISHSGLSLSQDDAAIHIEGNEAVIINNFIHDALHGVYVRAASGVRVENNRIRGIKETAIDNLGATALPATDSALCSVNQNRRGNGLHFWNSRDHIIVGNEISDTRDGIYFSFTRESRIERNHVYHARYGLHYMYSDGNYFANNHFEDNVAGAALMFSKDVVIYRNDFTNNRGRRAYGLLMNNVDSSMIRENRMEGNQVGIYMQSSHMNEVRNNGFVHNTIGMRLTSSSTGNLFHRNRIGLNLHNIDLAGRNNQNRWNENGRGNYWPGATTLDLDGDGASEMPHREMDLFGGLRENFPLVSLLTESPGLKALQFALQRAPIPNTHYITDEHPLTRPAQ
ncbi:MAG: NosD domain-containing protein [Opitutales bacterium]